MTHESERAPHKKKKKSLGICGWMKAGLIWGASWIAVLSPKRTCTPHVPRDGDSRPVEGLLPGSVVISPCSCGPLPPHGQRIQRRLRKLEGVLCHEGVESVVVLSIARAANTFRHTPSHQMHGRVVKYTNTRCSAGLHHKEIHGDILW